MPRERDRLHEVHLDTNAICAPYAIINNWHTTNNWHSWRGLSFDLKCGIRISVTLGNTRILQFCNRARVERERHPCAMAGCWFLIPAVHAAVQRQPPLGSNQKIQVVMIACVGLLSIVGAVDKKQTVDN